MFRILNSSSLRKANRRTAETNLCYTQLIHKYLVAGGGGCPIMRRLFDPPDCRVLSGCLSLGNYRRCCLIQCQNEAGPYFLELVLGLSLCCPDIDTLRLLKEAGLLHKIKKKIY